MWFFAWSLGWSIGCAPAPGVEISERVVSAGCGTCVFEMPEMKGCFWAVEIDGRAYPVSGEHPPDDMLTAHQAGGMCAGPRRARVSGEIRPDGRFLARTFELLPLAADAPSASPHHH